jgi:hypothetical protein
LHYYLSVIVEVRSSNNRSILELKAKINPLGNSLPLGVFYFMKFLEQNLEDIIFNADKEALEQRGLHIFESSKLIRQCRIGNYGICDLLSYYVDKSLDKPFINITIYELKQNLITNDTFAQAIRYAKGVKRYLDYRETIDYKINVVIIGSEIERNNDLIYLTDLLDYSCIDIYNAIASIECYTYDYKFDGIIFNYMGHQGLRDEGFGKLKIINNHE